MNCAICSTPLIGRQQKHCSPLCASRAFNAARKADGRLKAYREANAQRIHDYNATYAPMWRATESGKRAIQSGMARRRAILKGCEAEHIVHAEIFERDAWVCGICDSPVLASLRYPDPMSASLDHVIPLTRGGGHLKANVQLAHLVCNVSKGNRVA